MYFRTPAKKLNVKPERTYYDKKLKCKVKVYAMGVSGVEEFAWTSTKRLKAANRKSQARSRIKTL